MTFNMRSCLTIACAFGVLLGSAASSQAQGFPTYGNPLASYQVPSGIGYWKARQDRRELRSYRGNPGAQAILRQQRHNLCRNEPEVC